MAQQIPQFRLQERVNMVPVSTNTMASCRILNQPSLVKAVQDKTGSSLSTTVMPTRLRTMNARVDSPLQGMQDSISEPTSIVTDVNAPVIFSNSNTPFLNYLSPSCYVNSPSHMGTPLLLCTPPAYFSPAQINNGFPSVATSLDIPPAFELYNQNSSVQYPANVSCNISLPPLPSFHNSHPRNKLNITGLDAESTIAEKAASDANSGSSSQVISNVQAEKEVILGEMLEDDEDIWSGSCAYKE